MARTRYLVDTSVFARMSRPLVNIAFAPLAVQGQVAMCSPVAFELCYSARGPSDYRDLADRLSSFPSVPTTEADHHRALDVQATLATRSLHRAISLVDGLVAAIAEARQLIILHYDADFELIAEVTGQPHQWIVARGTSD